LLGVSEQQDPSCPRRQPDNRSGELEEMGFKATDPSNAKSC